MKRLSSREPARAALVFAAALFALTLTAPELSAQGWDGDDDRVAAVWSQSDRTASTVAAGSTLCVRPSGDVYLSDGEICRSRRDRILDLSVLGGGGGDLEEETSALTLEEGWQEYGGDYGGPQATKQGNVVILEGLVKSGSLPGKIAQLPEGWAPAKKLVFPSYSRYYRTRVDIQDDGSIVAVDGTNQWITLSGIVFKVKEK